MIIQIIERGSSGEASPLRSERIPDRNGRDIARTEIPQKGNFLKIDDSFYEVARVIFDYDEKVRAVPEKLPDERFILVLVDKVDVEQRNLGNRRYARARARKERKLHRGGLCRKTLL